MKPVAYCLFETPLGSCGIAWTECAGSSPPAVTLLQLPEATAKITEARIARNAGAGQASPPPPRIAEVILRIGKHFQGHLQDFRAVAIDLDGAGPFARRVYEAARNIPAGQTSTYGALARALGRPTAARAVGQALGRNPIALIIPCHRVLAAGGQPGGFSAHGGQATKAWMLAVEGAAFGPTPAKADRYSQSRDACWGESEIRLPPTADRPCRSELHRRRGRHAVHVESPVVDARGAGAEPGATRQGLDPAQPSERRLVAGPADDCEWQRIRGGGPGG
jgi:methylated-DNA-[protein]-cysteine S-methyltransferase